MSTVFGKISQVSASLAAVGIQKKDKNKHANYLFRGIDAVYNALAPALVDAQLLIIPNVRKIKHSQTTTSAGKHTNHWIVRVEYLLVDAESGDNMVTQFVGESYDTSDKGLNQALTAAYKYLMFELFCIPVEGSGDADAQNHQVEVQTISEDQNMQLQHLLGQLTDEEVKSFQNWLTMPVAEIPAVKFSQVEKLLTEKVRRSYEAQAKATAQSEAAQ